jgi:hypothetical protein
MNWPGAITAPERLEVAAHNPIVPPKRVIIATPVRAERRIAF